jgi:hypothetical protein
MFATRDLSEAVAVGHLPREDAYGPSPTASSTRGTKQIDLWIVLVPGQAADRPRISRAPSDPQRFASTSVSLHPIPTSGCFAPTADIHPMPNGTKSSPRVQPIIIGCKAPRPLKPLSGNLWNFRRQKRILFGRGPLMSVGRCRCFLRISVRDLVEYQTEAPFVVW